MKRGEESCAVKREKDHPQAVKGRAGSSAHENSVCGTTRAARGSREGSCVCISVEAAVFVLCSVSRMGPRVMCFCRLCPRVCRVSVPPTGRRARSFYFYHTDDQTHPVTPHPVTPHPVTPKPQGIVSRTLGGAGGLVKDAALYGAMTFGVGRCTSGRTCAPRTGRRRRTRSRRAPPRRYSTVCRRRHRRARRRR